MHNPIRNTRNAATNRPSLPEVADREPRETDPDCTDGDLHLSLDPRTGDLEDLSTFKVFLKKNLRPQAAPADLLANIYDRVDRIKAERTR